MKRRDFITLLGGAAALSPFAKPWLRPVMSRVAASSSNIAGRKANTIVFRNWQPIWSVVAPA
jgi:hypothetical protein